LSSSFFLFNFWGSCYISVFTACSILSAARTSAEGAVGPARALSITYAILGVIFGLFTGLYVLVMLVGFSWNVTAFEEMRGISGPRTGCLQHWEEVFGPRERWYLWLVPVPAFGPDDCALVPEAADEQQVSFL